MTDSETKIIAVVGATGAQGGGLIRAILAHPDAASPRAPSPATRARRRRWRSPPRA